MFLDSLFLRHPREQGETYAQHARFALGVGSRMVLGGLGCMAHAAVPAFFQTAGSRTVRDLADRIAQRPPAPDLRSRKADGVASQAN